MNKRTTTSIVAAIAALAFVAGSVMSQEKGEESQKPAAAERGAPDAQPGMGEWMKAHQPGARHDFLASLEGSWQTVASFRAHPDAEPAMSTGRTDLKMVLGGRYLRSDFSGDVMGMEFEGLGYTGYDNVRKKFVDIWLDNASTGVMMSYGTMDDNRKIITYHGEQLDPATGKPIKVRTVVRYLGDDRFVMEMWEDKPGLDEYKSMEIAYNRVLDKTGPDGNDQ